MPILDTVRKVINIVDYFVSIRDRVRNFFKKRKRIRNEKKIDKLVDSDNVSCVKRIMQNIRLRRKARRDGS